MYEQGEEEALIGSNRVCTKDYRKPIELAMQVSD